MDESINRLRKLQMSCTFQNGICYFFDGINDYEFDAEIVQDLLIENEEDFINECTFSEMDEDGFTLKDIDWNLIEDQFQNTLTIAIDKLLTDKKI